MVVAKKFVLGKLFSGPVTDENIKLEEEELLALKDGEVLFEAEFLSVDPYHRVMMEKFAMPTGTVMIGEQAARVIESKNSEYKVGETYLVGSGWRTHSVVTPGENPMIKVKPLKDYGMSLSLALGVLGMPGATAYLGITEILKPKEGDVLYANAAAGAVGSAVGQIAKILGCKVIGCAGTPEKIAWLKQIGFDVVFNYKTDDVSKELSEAAPNGIDCFFDNVGGESRNTILENHMAAGGRVGICGAISGYSNLDQDKISVSFWKLLSLRLSILPIVVYQCSDEQWRNAFDTMAKWIKEGKLQYKETVTEGFENAKSAFFGLFSGGNTGKAIVKVK